MSTRLISFLGRAPKRDDGKYRTTTYTFPDGTGDEAAFFGFSLRGHLRPDHLVVLGTAGSMWDHLFEQDVQFGEQEIDARLELAEAVAQQAVSQAQLDALCPMLADSLGCAVALRLIPYGRSEDEQTSLVQTLSQFVTADDVLHLDVTHCFRHLPMLAAFATLHLRAVHPGLRLGGVWYGSYDEDTRTAPVYDLSGLLSLADWAEAIHRYDGSGDHGVFAPLLPTELGKLLEEAAFFERVQNPGQARRRLKEVRQRLQAQPLQGVASLFVPELLVRVRWADEGRLYQRQRELARQCLSRGDELRAALLGFEAFITRVMTRNAKPGVNSDNHDHRDTAKRDYEADVGRGAERDNYRLLRDIRNQLAHGVSSPRVEVQRAIQSALVLRRELARLLDELLPDLP